MTTIAYRDKVMAADRLMNWSGVKAKTTKIVRAGNALIGAAGSAQDAGTFIRWWESGADLGSLPEIRQYGDGDAPNFEILVLRPGPRLTLYTQHFQPVDLEEDFWAIGSGAKAAMGAMHMGASAEKAVEVAAMVDCYTGGRVQVERLEVAEY